MDGIGAVIGLAILVLFILLMRAFGAWMLRIDEVIKEQKATNDYLKVLIRQNDLLKEEFRKKNQ